jgi:glucose-6-phosphate isomerase
MQTVFVNGFYLKPLKAVLPNTLLRSLPISKRSKAFGIDPENTFPMSDWVGGRFSLWSTVGLSICLAVGPDHFKALLRGAGKMDLHFQETPFKQNIPVVLGLLSIWYNNLWGAESEAIIPYTEYLKNLPCLPPTRNYGE